MIIGSNVSVDLSKPGLTHRGSKSSTARGIARLCGERHLSLWLLLAVVGCGGPARPVAESRPPKVVCVESVEEEITDSVVLIGRTQAFETVEVRSRVSGFVQSIEFTDGAMVAEGELLAKIEPDEYQAIYDQSQSRIDIWESKRELAQTKLKRSELLISRQAISKEEYDQDLAGLKEADAQLVAAKADLARTALDLKYTEVRAAISGRIDRALVTRGNLVTGGLGSGTLLTRIVNDRPMYAYLQIDEQTALGLMRRMNVSRSQSAAGSSIESLGIACYLQLQDEKDFTRQGIIDFAENKIDSSTGASKIRARFDNEDGLLKDGMFVRAKVLIGQPYRAVVIPEQAIGMEQSSRFVFVVNGDGKAERLAVELGERRGDRRVVLKGLHAGQYVIAQGVQRVRPGMLVDFTMSATD
jgi:RND family efflux transporter MFP subunit